MDIPRFESLERVDLGDFTQVSFLVLGEFRRTMRFLMGEEAKYIVRGFEVLPESPASTRIEINLNNTGNPASLALGPENTGSQDYGQLIGGKGSDGSFEGNAQQLVDFSGEPAATYIVEMRFVPYTTGTGDNDNRVFWNDPADAEFVSAIDTRYLASWTAQIVSSATGGEWIQLASVVWDGVSIDAGDITDLRDFIFEGTVGAFDAASQGAAGGMDDFDRTAAREDLGVGLNEVYPILRAIGRQIQDIKGPDPDGNWNWYGRVFRPFDDANSLLNSQQTKSLRSIDTVSYTIGDGTTTFGDFNGADGLEDCLQHLEDLADERPLSVEIVLKTNSAVGFAWNITSEHDFATDEIQLTLRGRQGRGPAIVNTSTIPASDYCFRGGNQSIFVFDNVIAPFGFANNSGFVSTLGGVVKARGCTILGDTSVSAVPVILAGFSRFELVDCEIQGVVEVTGFGNTQGYEPSDEGGLIQGCTFNEAGLRSRVQSVAAGDGVENWVPQMTVRDCQFEITETSRLGLNGVLDLGAPVGWHIQNCRISYNGDMDGIHFQYDSDAGKTSVDTKIDKCVLSQATTGTHSVDSGTNGANGTGWGIYLDGVTGGGRSGDLSITDCRFEGSNSLDAGGLFMSEPLGVQIRGCVWRGNAHNNSAGTRYSCIYITTASADTEVNVHISDCTIRDWADTIAGSVGNSRGIYLNNVADVSISNCNIDGGSFGTPITVRNTTFAGLYLDGTCEDIKVLGCTFENWGGDASTNSRAIVSGSGSFEKITISNCRFRENGGFSIDFNAAAVLGTTSIIGNIMNLNYQGIDLRATLVASCACSQNIIFDNGGAGTDAIAWPVSMASHINICMGNVSNMNIRGDTNIYGYAEAGQDLNAVNSYT